MWLMQTGDRHEVANGFDGGRVDVVVDNADKIPVRDNVLAFQVLLLKEATPRWNTTSGIQQHTITTSSGT